MIVGSLTLFFGLAFGTMTHGEYVDRAFLDRIGSVDDVARAIPPRRDARYVLMADRRAG